MQETRDSFEKAFVAVSEKWRETVGRLGTGPGSEPVPEVAVRLLVRSAAKVEQTFGGINASLWDDPYEWTLPEAMDSKEKILEYLEEVDAARRAGFQRISEDCELSRVIPTPFGEMSLAHLLLTTICEAERLAGASDAMIASAPGKT